MGLPVSTIDAITTLGRRNKKEDCANTLITLLKGCYLQCEEDYKHTSTNKRFSTGKLEKKIFIMLADICHWENGNDNAKQAGDIMIMLGYMSYKERPNRFRQKVENEKKKRNGKLQHRRRRVPVRRVQCDDFISEESYSDNEPISEPDIKSESDVMESSFSDSPSTSSVEVFNDGVVGFTDNNSPTNVFSEAAFTEYPMDDIRYVLPYEENEESFKQFQSSYNKDSLFPIIASDSCGYDDELLAGLSQPLNENIQEDQYSSCFFDW